MSFYPGFFSHNFISSSNQITQFPALLSGSGVSEASGLFYLWPQLESLMSKYSLIILTWDVPAMSTPASRKLLKSCPNLLVALARSWVVPLDDWTTSLADWFRPAATSFSWAWTSWKLLPLDGNYGGRRRTMTCASGNTMDSVAK